MSGLKKASASVRRATSYDIGAISEIEEKCFPEPTAYSKKYLKMLLSDDEYVTFVEEQNNVMRGFIMFHLASSSRKAQVETIDVDPQFRGQGVALTLLNAAVEYAKRNGARCIQLEVSEGNEPAKKLYQKAGFVFKERIENYYLFDHCGTRNAIRMIKTLGA